MVSSGVENGRAQVRGKVIRFFSRIRDYTTSIKSYREQYGILFIIIAELILNLFRSAGIENPRGCFPIAVVGGGTTTDVRPIPDIVVFEFDLLQFVVIPVPDQRDADDCKVLSTAVVGQVVSDMLIPSTKGRSRTCDIAR